MNIVYIATSLASYIAYLNEKFDFSKKDNSKPNNIDTYQNFYDSIDEIVMRANTYKQIIEVLSPNNWPYNKKSYLLSESISEKSNSDYIEIVNTFESLLPKIKNKKRSLYGGSQPIKLLRKSQLIMSIISVILGKDRLLFKHFNEQILTLGDVVNYNEIVECYYQINWNSSLLNACGN